MVSLQNNARFKVSEIYAQENLDSLWNLNFNDKRVAILSWNFYLNSVNFWESILRVDRKEFLTIVHLRSEHA